MTRIAQRAPQELVRAHWWVNEPFVGSEGVTLPKTSENVSECKIEHAKAMLIFKIQKR